MEEDREGKWDEDKEKAKGRRTKGGGRAYGVRIRPVKRNERKAMEQSISRRKGGCGKEERMRGEKIRDEKGTNETSKRGVKRDMEQRKRVK